MNMLTTELHTLKGLHMNYIREKKNRCGRQIYLNNRASYYYPYLMRNRGKELNNSVNSS